MRELDHGLAGGDLLIVLVAHHDVDQNPARVHCRLFRFHDAARLDGVAGPDRLDPTCLEAAVDCADRVGPVRHHPRNQAGRMVQPRPEQITSPRWLKNTLSCTTNSRSRLMNLSSARAESVMTSPGRAGIL